MFKKFFNHTIHTIIFGLVTLVGFLISLLPFKTIYYFGKFLGSIAYYLCKPIRKLSMHNIALANTLQLNETQMKCIIKESFQNLLITCLEYFKLRQIRYRMHKLISCENMDAYYQLKQQNKGVLIVTGHFANWEICSLEFTQTEHATIVGRPIKNKRLYNKILNIRQMHHGRIINSKQALQKGVQKLKQGGVFALLVDQSLSESSYHYPLFGTRAWTSIAPGLLAYKTGSPILVAITKRHENGKYTYRFSNPIIPDTTKPLKQEVIHVMDQVMDELEQGIRNTPGQWLWQHRRWKQEGFVRVYKTFKYNALLVIMPKDKKLFHLINAHLAPLRQMYTRSFITVLVPKEEEKTVNLKDVEIMTYENQSDLFINDWKFQLIYDFYDCKPLRKHFLKLGAFKAFTFKDLIKKIPKNQLQLSDPVNHNFLVQSICIPNTVFPNSV